MSAIKDPVRSGAVDLKPLSTFKIGGQAAALVKLTNANELPRIYRLAKEKALEILVLGEGSNLIFDDRQPLKRLLVKNEILGYEEVRKTDEHVWLRIGAGEHWDSVVARAVRAGFSGIEAMSGIPGTAGATPVQNVGAYGQEIKDILESVEAYDTQNDCFVSLTNAACQFDYRETIFKRQPGRYVITAIILKLTAGEPEQPHYASLRRYLDERGWNRVNAHQIRQAVLTIRSQKLPDPALIPSCGSFFKNPLVSKTKLNKLLKDYPDLPWHGTKAGNKIPAGWLIEQCGLKGKELNGLVVYANHALVLTNPNQASFTDLLAAKQTIVQAVQDKFGIELKMEPQIIS